MITTANRNKSADVFKTLLDVTPGGVNSPVRAFKGLLDFPVVAERGVGDTVYDVDGNSYIDYCQSWGALLHGHAHPEVIEAAYTQMKRGTTFGLTTPYEEALASKIISLVPSVEKIRFVSSGTEATMSAVRLARGFTGKSLLVKFTGNYHGHADYLLVKAGSGVIELNAEATSAGVPKEITQTTMCLPYNDISSFETFMDLYGPLVAAIMIEPVAGNMGVVPAQPAFLRSLRQLSTHYGALLIFDEVMSGFRVAKGGAQSIYTINPDLTCFSKIIGGGFPCGAFGGRREVMDCLAPLGQVYQAGTLSGNPVAMCAGLKALELLDTPTFYEELTQKARVITEPLKAYIKTHNLNACVQHVGGMFTIFFGRTSVNSMEEAEHIDTAKFKDFFCFLLERGILAPPAAHEAWFVSSVHTDAHLTETRDACLAFLKTSTL